MSASDTSRFPVFVQRNFPATRSTLGWRAAVLVMFLLLAIALFGTD